MYKLIFIVVLSFLTTILNAQTYYVNDAANAGIDHFSSFVSVVPGTNGMPGMAMGGGVAWLDINNDGWEDLYLPGGLQPDQLYINNQDGTFMDISIASGIYSATSAIETVGVSSADIDRDGDADVIVTTTPAHPNLLFVNNGNGTFTESGATAGLSDVGHSMGISCGDYDQDGWIDLYFTNWRVMTEAGLINEAYSDRLYHNNGDGTFSDVTQLGPLWATGCGLASVFSDYDLDGDPDLLLANDFGKDEWFDPNQIYNNENGVFTNVTESMDFGIGMNAMGFATGDFDEDQDFDYYITNIDTNKFMRNDGAAFTEIASDAGVECNGPVIGEVPEPGERSWSWGTVFFDYDHDTYVDLFSCNGFIFPGGFDQDRLYRNNSADGTFTDVSIQTGMDSEDLNRGCAIADYDHDGDLDMFIVTMDTVGGMLRSKLMKNVGASGNWIEFSLTGTNSNINALGAVVRLSVDGRHLLREVDSGGSSFLSHHSSLVHYGLGQYPSVDSVQITWPNGDTQSLYNLEANQRMNVIEGVDPNSIAGSEFSVNWVVYPNPTNGVVYINLDLNKPLDFKILSINGKVLMHDQLLSISAKRFKINIDQLEPGTYILEIGGRSEIVVKM